MASSWRYLASPRNATVAAQAIIRTGTPGKQLGQNLTPRGIDVLRRAKLSPSPIGSPFAQSIKLSNREHSPLVVRQKTARRLPWSEKSENDFQDELNEVDILAEPLQKKSRSDSQVIEEVLSANTPDRPKLYDRITKGEKVNFLGKGGFGIVIAAHYKGKSVAVKLLSLESERKKMQFRNEMNAISLDHPNIVKVYKIINQPNELFGLVVMHRVIGQDMQELLNLSEFKITHTQKIKFILDISKALEYCHKKNIIHLDVKPKNVLIESFNNVCKLCDFGCSLSINEKENYSFQGTAKYAAPEVLREVTITPAADIYSLGITMWQVMSGVCPYQGQDHHSVIYKVVTKKLRPCVPSNISSQETAFVDLYKKCWAQSPDNRPSINTVIDELSKQLAMCQA